MIFGYDNLDLGTLEAAGVVAAYTLGPMPERLRPFGARLLYMARHAVDPTIEEQFGMRYASLDDLLGQRRASCVTKLRSTWYLGHQPPDS